MQIDFDKMDGLAPAIVQEDSTGEVLMVGFMNPEAYCAHGGNRLRYVLFSYSAKTVDERRDVRQPLARDFRPYRLRP